MSKKRRLIISLVIAAFLALALVYDKAVGNYQTSHIFIFAVAYLLGLLFLWSESVREWWGTGIEFLGLENSGVLEIFAGSFGGIILSVYLFLSDSVAVIPPVLQFSIIPVSAVLGGLVISGANHSSIHPQCRKQLLKASQNLIVATILFIFFTILFFVGNVGGGIDMNQLPIDKLGWMKLVINWIALILFVVGTGLFVIGIINLARGLYQLKKQ